MNAYAIYRRLIVPPSRATKRNVQTKGLRTKRHTTEHLSLAEEIPVITSGVSSGALIYATQGSASIAGGQEAADECIRFRLPFPPSVNGLFRNFIRGRVKTGQYKKWIKEAFIVFEKQTFFRLPGRVTIKILLFRPDKRKRDLDNYVKALLDFLVAQGVIEDDSTVQSLMVAWAKEIKKEGESWVEIAPC